MHITDVINDPALKHVTIKIAQDSDAPNPRKEHDNATVMMCLHRRYDLGDKHEFKEPDGFEAWWAENGDGGVRQPLFLYDHSGLTISTSPFACRWDSGQIGYVYMTKAAIEKEFGGDLEKAKACIKAEVETYDQYLRGDVYGYIIEDAAKEERESCWGFFGHEYAIEEAKAAAKHVNDKIADEIATALAERIEAERPDLAPAY